MDRRRAAGVLLALAACVAYATAAPTSSNHTSLDLYDGTPEGCYYNFQHYGESDRIMTNEPCLNCTCHNRMLMCYLRVCPFTKAIGQDCTVEKRADQCCPIVTCPDVPVDLLTSTTTSPAEYGATGLGKLDKYGCSIHGKYFPEGSKVPPTPNKPCEHCYCIRNMTTCVMQECTLHVDGCTPIYHKDVCCPVRYSCDHPADEMPLLDDLSTTVRPTPGFLLTTTTLSPVTQMSQDCLYENQVISDGALIKTEKACDHCYCMKGDIVCVVQECGTPMENEGKNCTALAPREGVCCPDTYICEGDEPTTGTYEAPEYTTESEKLTTLSPPRRAGSEGSGYRIEPDGIPNTESPTFESDTEGSGYEQATIHPHGVTEVLPDSHKIEPSDEILSSTGEPNEFIAITTTKEPVSDHADITTESNMHEETAPQQYETVSSTASTYISQKVDDSSTTIAQDEDIGSGEEDVITPYDISQSATPVIDVSEPTKVTTESNIEDAFGKKPTTTPIVDENKTNIPNELYTDDSVIDITTETRRHLDDDEEGIKSSTTFNEEYYGTQHEALQTTSVPSTNEDKKESTTLQDQDNKTFDTHQTTISISSFEDDITTTEPHDGASNSFEGGTGPDVDIHHQITMTASTPLLEEIERDTTDQENIPYESTSDGFKTTTSSNTPKEEGIDKDSLKPDLIDKTILSNISTTVSAFENNDVTTAGPQKTQETNVDDSSETQQYVPTTIAPAFDDITEKLAPSDSTTAFEPQQGQETDMEDSSKPQQYVPITSAPAFEDESKITTPSDLATTLATQEDKETHNKDSSKLQPDYPTTYAFEDEIKQTTQSDYITTSIIQEHQETDVEASSEPQKYAPSTTSPVIDDETVKMTPSDYITTSIIQEHQETDVEASSEPQKYAPSTSSPVINDETVKITLSDFATTSEPQDGQEIDIEASSEPQQYESTTSAPTFETDTKKATPYGFDTTSKVPEGQDTVIEDGSEPQQYAPTTSVPVLEDEAKKRIPSDSMTTSATQEGQETDVDESSGPQQYAPTSSPVDETKKTPAGFITTSVIQEHEEVTVESSSELQQYSSTTSLPTFEDDSKKTTSSEIISTSKAQVGQETDVDESSEPQQYAPTTNAPIYEDEIKKTTTSDPFTTSRIQEGQETYVETSSEPHQYVTSTSSPASEDETIKSTLSDYITTSKILEDQETYVETSSVPDQYVPSTSSVSEDDTIKSTPTDSITTSKIQEDQGTYVESSSEQQQYVPSTSSPVYKDETIKSTPSGSITTSKIEEDQETYAATSLEPQQYVPSTRSPILEDETIKSTPSDSMTTIQEGHDLNIKASSEPQRYDSTSSAPVFEDETKKTTPSELITTSQTQMGQETDVEESSEPQQYHPTTSDLPLEDENKKTTPSDSMTTSKMHDDRKPVVEESSEPQEYGTTTSASAFVDDSKKTSSATTYGEIDVTTAEPDKSLNTIPSGVIEEETTEYLEQEKQTHKNEMIPTESVAENENELIYTTSLPHTSSSQDQSTLSTEKENDEKIVSIETHDTEQTTVLADISEEGITTLAHDHRLSTEIPTSEYQESNTSPVAFNTESEEQTVDSKKPVSPTYESSSQATDLNESTSERQETVTSSSIYATVPSSTTADLDENEIINESRIPGEGDCLLNGVTYKNESAVPSTNKCQSGCRCSSSIIKCDPIICSPPPEYMDNCQTTYDSLDSCCPTYVCDHKTETMPPQSHSQMSGTEAPVTTIKCNGDECVLNENESQTSESCKSGNCTSQDNTSPYPSNIPEQPTVDHHVECSEENGCQVSPVKPCEGTECEIISDPILPQKQQPCSDGNDCDVPVQDCGAGKCGSNDEHTLDIEKECTEKSCKRKQDELEQPPKLCSGSECSPTEADVKENLNVIEKSSVSPSPTELDFTTKSTEDFTNEPDRHVTIPSDTSSKPLPTSMLPDITTKRPDLDSVNDEMSTIYESATPSENRDSTKDAADDEITFKTSTSVADTYITEKLREDVTTESGVVIRTDSPDLSLDEKTTTETVEETKTHPPKTPDTETKEITEAPLEIDDQETTTLVSDKKYTEPTKIDKTQEIQSPEMQIPEDTATTILDDNMLIKPTKTQSDTFSTEPSVSPSVKPQDVTEIPTDTPAKTTAIYDIEEFTKLPHVSDVEDATTKINEDFGSTTPKAYDLNSQETSKSPQATSDDMVTQIADTQTPELHVTDIDEITKTTKGTPEETTTKTTSEFTQPEVFIDDQETTKLPIESSSDEITKHVNEEHTTELSMPNDSEETEVTKSPEVIPSETTASDIIRITDDISASEITTQKSTATESSTVVETKEQIATKPLGDIELTTIKITDVASDSEPSKHDQTSHETTTVQQLDSEEEVSLVSKFNDETETESSKPNELEPFDTTTLSNENDSTTTTTKAIKESEIDPIKSVDLDLTPVTQAVESDFVTTASLPISVSEQTTKSVLEQDSMSTVPEVLDINETTTKILEQSQPTQSIIDSATESIDKATSTLSVSLIHQDEDKTTISDRDNLTEPPLKLVTQPEPYSEITGSADKSSESETTTSGIELSSTDSVTKLPTEQDSKTSDEHKETTEANMEIDKLTLKPTTNALEDDKTQEDINSSVPTLLESEKDTISDVTTLIPNDETDIKTEQPEIVNSLNDKQPPKTLDEITEKLFIAEKATTLLPIAPETKLPVGSSETPLSSTDEPFISEQKPSSIEPSDIDTPKIDHSETETPFRNEATTDVSETQDTASPIEIVKDPETTQYQDLNSKPTESEEETYTKVPSRASSEAADIEYSHTSEQIDEELTTPTVKITEPTTEPSDSLTKITTESIGVHILDAEKPIETTPKQSSETHSTPVSSTSLSDNKETEATVTESSVKESSTKEQFPTHILSTESPKESYTEAFEKPVTTETEKVLESVTESVEKDTEIKTTPEQEDVFEQTVPAEHTTKVQDQNDNDFVDLATDTNNFGSTIPSIFKTTKAPEVTETSMPLSEMITSKPGEDIETSRPTYHLETTTSAKIDDESSPVDKETTEIPVTISAQETTEMITSPIDDLTTKKQEATTEFKEDFIPIKTGKPEMYPTTMSAPEKSTQSPVEEASTISTDQIQLTTIGSHVTEGEQPPTTIVSDQAKTEIEVQTEKVTTPTEIPFQPEASSKTPHEEIRTTAKVEEFSTASPEYDKFTKPTHKSTEAPSTEQPKPIPTEKQPTDDLLTPDEEPSIPSGTSGYGSDPDYMEEDQTFGPGTCRYGGKVYVSAQQIPRDDPCDFCFCFRSDIICLQQSCPPPIHGCHEEPISGFCCPRYECPVSMATTVNVTTTTTTTTTTLPPHFPVHSYKGSAQKRGCLIKGHTYKVGEVVRASSGPCLHCTCGGDGQMKCDPKQCTPEPMLRQMIAAAVSAKRRR